VRILMLSELFKTGSNQIEILNYSYFYGT